MMEALPAAHELEYWRVQEVTEWLQRCGFSWQATSYFRSHDISGRRMLEMDDWYIQQMHSLNPKEKSALKNCLNQCKRKSGAGVQERIRNIQAPRQQSGTLPPPRPPKSSHGNHHAQTLPMPSKQHYPSYDHNSNESPGGRHHHPAALDDEDDPGDETDEFESDVDDDYIEPDEDPVLPCEQNPIRSPDLPTVGMVANIKAELERRGTLKKLQDDHIDQEDIYDTPEQDHTEDDTYEVPSDHSSGEGTIHQPPGHVPVGYEEEDHYLDPHEDGPQNGAAGGAEEIEYLITDRHCPPPRPAPGMRAQPHHPQPPSSRPLPSERPPLTPERPARPGKGKAPPPKPPSSISDEFYEEPDMLVNQHPGFKQPAAADDTYEITDGLINQAQLPQPARPPKRQPQPSPVASWQQPPVTDDTYEITDPQPERPLKNQPHPSPVASRQQPPVTDDTYEIADGLPSPPQPGRPPKSKPQPSPAASRQPPPMAQQTDDLYEVPDIQPEPAQPVKPPKPTKLGYRPPPTGPPPTADNEYEIASPQLPSPQHGPGRPHNPIRTVPQPETEDNYEIAEPSPAKAQPPFPGRAQSSIKNKWPPPREPEEAPKPVEMAPVNQMLVKELQQKLTKPQLQPPAPSPRQPKPRVQPLAPVEDDEYELMNPSSAPPPVSRQFKHHTEDNGHIPTTEGVPPAVPVPTAQPPSPRTKDPLPNLPSKPKPSEGPKPSPGGGRPLPVPPPAEPQADGRDIPDEFKNVPYFQGHIERKDAEKALREHGMNGSFLIKFGNKAKYTMCLYYNEKVIHLPIPFDGNTYRLGNNGQEKFKSVVEMVNYHRKNLIHIMNGGRTVLTSHCPVYGK